MAVNSSLNAFRVNVNTNIEIALVFIDAKGSRCLFDVFYCPPCCDVGFVVEMCNVLNHLLHCYPNCFITALSNFNSPLI